MPERMWKWQRRIMWGSDRLASLDFGAELWKWDIGAYESVDGIRVALGRSGRPFDDDKILYEATQSLLLDVVHAGGGVESAFERLTQSVGNAQASHDEWTAGAGAHLRDSPEPELGTGWSDCDIEDAWYAVAEMIVWARTLDERLKRPAKNQPDQGLVPALAPGPRRDAVVAARSRLLTSHLQEARYLATLNLHMQSAHAGSPMARVRSGRLMLPFPDKVVDRVSHRWQLTYRDGRDAIAYADDLMVAVDRFMNDMIEAFEQHLPERFKTATT